MLLIDCLRTRVRKQPIIALYFEFENELKLYNLEGILTLLVPMDFPIKFDTVELG